MKVKYFFACRFRLRGSKRFGRPANTVSNDGVEQVLVEMIAEHSVMPALHGYHRLKRFQRLNRSLEADRPWFEAMLARGLSDDGADQVVGQDMGPDLLSHELRRPAAQDVHLQRLL